VASELPQLIKSRGCIVNTAAVVNLMRTMAMDYAEEGVRVNSVCPSVTLTETAPMGRIMMPADIAAVIAFLASDDARFVTGVNLPVDGGVTASNGQPKME
jgi:meso-butanediol dehydrogenase/(S,S)-butanediol dehydrogenase/diacetyl reductase